MSSNTPPSPPPGAPARTGAELIADERQRQIDVEGWTADHDEVYDRAELATAAGCYLAVAEIQAREGFTLPPCFRPKGWPWLLEWWKPTRKDPVRNLVKAGALIAAEIDRIQRKEGAA